MQLSQNDKRILKEFGHKQDDFSQIERATNKSITTYEYSDGKEHNPISREQAIELLGRRKWLTGISRSAFHWSSVQLIDNNNEFEKVSFDSSRLFR